MHIINTSFLVTFYNLVDMCLPLYKFSLFLCGGTLKVFYMNKTIFSYCLQTTQNQGLCHFWETIFGSHISMYVAVSCEYFDSHYNIYVIVY